MVVVGLLVVPLQTTLIPILPLFADLGITGSVPDRLAGPHRRTGCRSRSTCCATSWAALPKEVFESASIDGASPVTSFFRLALPDERAGDRGAGHLPVPVRLERPARRADLPRLSNPENLPLTVTIANLVNSLGGGWEFLGAAAFISMALPLAVFFGLQRYFVRGITGGSVKG